MLRSGQESRLGLRLGLFIRLYIRGLVKIRTRGARLAEVCSKIKCAIGSRLG